MPDTDVQDLELTSVDVVGTRTPAQVLKQKYDVQQIMEHVLEGPSQEKPGGVHYGPSFPGSRKNSLLLAGAQTLASTFGLVPRYTVTEIPEGKGRRYQVTTKLYSRSGLFLGEGIGECSTEEEKFAWQEAVCQAEFDQFLLNDAARIKFRRDRNEQGYTEVKQVRVNVADRSNTVLKISKKRSLVDGIILVLDCSDIFDQDFEELGEELGLDKREPKDVKKPPKQGPAPLIQFGDAKGKKINDPTVATKDLEKYMAAKKGRLARDDRDKKWDEQDKATITAIEQELAHRASQAKAIETPRPQEAVSGTPAPTAPQVETRKPLNDHAWRDAIIAWEDEHRNSFEQAKAEWGAGDVDALPPSERWRFYDTVEKYIAANTGGE
jgi:hypothetical protein